MTAETTTEEKIPHIVLEVELRVPVKVPRLLVTETMQTEPVDLNTHQLRELIEGDPDRLHDAIDAHLESMPDLEVEYVDDVDEAKPESFRTIRPADLGPIVVDDPENEGETITVQPDPTYREPAPSFLERVKFTNEGVEFVVDSPYNGLTDEQLRGALHVVKYGVWNLPGMNRRQKAAMIRVISELEWIALARPALHFFKASDEDATICSYCGQVEPGHDVKKEQASVNEAQAQ